VSVVLDVRDLSKSHGARKLFQEVSFSVAEGEKIGLIGRNGTGKSTLFRILAGEEGPDAGTVALRRGLRVGILSQDPAFPPEQRLIDAVGTPPAGVEGWEWTPRVERILTQLGVGGWERPMGTLSGGERRRVALARTLMTDPELLLLDEPTNHLDADSVLWLEETLFDFPGAALIITHDRYFLDRVVDRMLELSSTGLEGYEGGYTEYLEERAAREART
jgi:ABC transport system ATP-binding/permease protein